MEVRDIHVSETWTISIEPYGVQTSSGPASLEGVIYETSYGSLGTDITYVGYKFPMGELGKNVLFRLYPLASVEQELLVQIWEWVTTAYRRQQQRDESYSPT